MCLQIKCTMKLLNTFRHIVSLIAFSATISLLAISCKKDDVPVVPATRPDIVFYALTSDSKLNKYNAKTAETPTSSYNITGLASGETLLSIDFRPATGQLYALSSNSRLYTLNTETGAALIVGSAAFTPALASQVANIDFNPTVDRIRMVTNSGQNLRLHPETGATAATDANINGGASPSITSIAYKDNKAGNTTTTLFDIDFTTKKLYKQDPPNNGTLVEIGNLNVDFTGKGGFDINADNSVALATFTVSSITKLYQLDLASANATYLADIAGNVVDIAIPTNPVAYAIDESNNLQILDPTKPQTFISKAVTGLQVAENIVGIDFRPSTGQLYALGSTSRLYTINTASGAVTLIGTAGAFTLTGTSFGFDFNPTVDRIRVVSNLGQNIRLNPNDGTLPATDANINPGTPMVSGAAYTNNFAGATTTMLYVLDGATSKLFRQDPPNNGTLVEIGPLGVTIDAANGFDIGSKSGVAYAILTSGASTRLYTINLTTGIATAIGDFPNKVRAFSVGLAL